VDVLPTLCEIAGVRPPDGRRLDGASILPALEGQRIRRRVPLHWRYYNAIDRPRVALRAGDWKILGIPDKLSPRGTGSSFDPQQCMPYIKDARLVEFELYNLPEDLGEKNNLAAKEPRRLKELSERLIQLDREIRAEGPDWRTAGAG
jgi:arylsulfatase A-like enzyme